MRQYSVSYAKNNLSALLAAVRAGEQLVIADRGVPVAMLVPPVAEFGATGDKGLDSLIRSGLVTRGAAAPPLELLAAAPPTPRRGTSAVAALLAERESGW